MSRTERVVPAKVWRLANWLGPRSARLTDVPPPSALLRAVLDRALEMASAGFMNLRWQPCDDMPEFGRLQTEFQLPEVLFDQFVNGRSGYRAQYFLSPEEGVLFNHDLMHGLDAVIQTAVAKQGCEHLREDFLVSLAGPHSKVWVYQEQAAFDVARDQAIVPERWVQSGTHRGTRAPLPSHLMLDLKGAFIHPASGALFVDDLKADRACDLYRRGYT